jgi:hypothetical protein
MQPDDQPPLKGVARSLDDLFARVQGDQTTPIPAPPVRAVPRRTPPSQAPDPHDLQEGPLLDADTLVQEIAGPSHEQPRTDPEEERRARMTAAADSLAQGVHAFVSDRGDREALAQRIRDESVALKEENFLDPLIDATELLARNAPAIEPSLARDLAHFLTTPAVSWGLALRLAAARDEVRRAELIEAFRRLDEEAAVALSGALAEAEDRSARRNLVEGLVAMSELGLKQAEQMVREGNDWGVVRNGVVILGELGGERAVAQLMDTIQHHKQQVRRETIAALARIGGEGAMLLLMGRLEDDDDGVRASAARALGNLGSERVVKTLLARLDDEDSEEALQEMLRALGQLGDPGAVTAIEKRAVGSFLRRRPSSAVRLAAYRALALIGTPHAKKLIDDATNDKDAEVRALARSLSGRT